jgi:hypothetical protein
MPAAHPSATAHSAAVVEGRKSRDHGCAFAAQRGPAGEVDVSENEFLSEDEDNALAGSPCFQPPLPSLSIPPRVLSFSVRVQT